MSDALELFAVGRVRKWKGILYVTSPFLRKMSMCPLKLLSLLGLIEPPAEKITIIRIHRDFGFGEHHLVRRVKEDRCFGLDWPVDFSQLDDEARDAVL
ncbi:hypothetical protein Tco_0492632 [Tanacetum coccineum]